MVKTLSFLVLLLSFSAYADFLGFGGGDNPQSQIPALIDKLKGLEMKVDPGYEDEFNKSVKALETRIEEEKLFCSGEMADSQGKVLPADKKQLCIRELKKSYLEATDIIHELKRKYLGMIHTRQVERLGEIHKKLKSDIEKNF